MKLILVSDLHLVAPGFLLRGLDPLAGLEACIADINRNHADADLVVIAGDLAHDGEPEAYRALAGRLRHLVPPCRLMMGNHDDRDAFLRIFPDAEQEAGFIQSAIDLPFFRLILLDTLSPGNVAGLLCRKRLDWLDRQLEAASDALVVMHHPPFPIGIPSLDECRLHEPDHLLPVLKRRGNVRHIFAGHVHRLSHGEWHGIPFTTLRGTNHQSALALEGPHRASFEAPSYAVVLALPGGMVVHTQEF